LDDGKYHGQCLYSGIDDLPTPEIDRQSISWGPIEQDQKGSMKITIKIIFYCFSQSIFTEKLNKRDSFKLLTKQQHTDFVKETKYPKETQRSDFVDHACITDDSEI
jgi:hypothetical protein